MSGIKKNDCDQPIEVRAAFEVQQSLGEVCALSSEVVWDVLGPDQDIILKTKLECMFPDDKKIYTCKADIRRSMKHNRLVKQVKLNLFRNIWQQRKYTKGVLLHSIIYVLVTPKIDLKNAKHSRNYTIHPVFRTRRCLNANTSHGCCMIFIDEHCRIYQNWNDFIKNNEYPIGTMIAPKNGNYSINAQNEIELEYYFTPAYTNKNMRTADTLIPSLSAVNQTVGMIHPVFTIVGIVASSYGAIRDYKKMSDNIERGTETNVNRNISLGCNIITISSSILALGSQMSNSNLSYSSNMALQTLNGAATAINFTKLIITSYDLFTRYFLDDEQLDFTDMLQFGTSLLLFTNSVNNMAITSVLGKVGGITLRNTIQFHVRAGLALVSNEVMKFASGGGIIELLRLANDIPYKNVLCNMHTIYTNLTRSGFLTTLSVVGACGIEIIPGLLVQVVNKDITEFNFTELTKHYGSKFVKHIANSHSFIDVLNGLCLYFSETVVQFLLNQTRSFIETNVEAIDATQNTFVSTEMVLYKMISYIAKNYKDHSIEFLNEKTDDIIAGVAQYFISLNPTPSDGEAKKHNCNICGGYFYLLNNG